MADTTSSRASSGRAGTSPALSDALDQLQATGEILQALGQAGSDVESVLRTVGLNARRLCGGDAALVYLFEGRSYRLAWSSGLTDEFRSFVAEHPITMDRATLVGRVGLDRRPQQITDVLADPEYGRADAQRLGHYRSIIGAPMLLGEEVIGVLSVWRNRVAPFSDRATDLLVEFAAPAAIAVRTARLLHELESHKKALTTRLDQLEALSTVGEAVSATLDLDQVLSTIVTQAVALSGADGGSILEFDPELAEFRIRTTYGTSPAQMAALRGIRVGLHDSLVGRAARERRPLQVADLAIQADDEHMRLLRDAGWRSVVAVPMLREGRVVGALLVRRRTPGEVDDSTCHLLQTFASQSSLALTNAQLYRRLEEQSAELAAASRHKSEFLASMSHELRTPLNAIIGFSEVLLERLFGDVNDRQEEYLGDIHSSGQHLLALLNDVLDLSKVEAGKMVLETTSVDVPTFVHATAGLVRERAHRSGLALEVRCDDLVPPVVADELRLRQVLLNLLTNAIKFTPSGGSVVVRARLSGPEVEIAVSDTGVGVAQADRERIFESFQQGERAMSAQEGTGLGLTLSRRIVELHGGRIWLESDAGAGSTFAFTVPAHSTHADRRSFDSGDDRPYVLVVEDDRPSADLMTILLEEQGLAAATAPTGERALAILRDRIPAAVVLDIRLPGIDGWEVLARIKDSPDLAHVPVIVVSIVDERGRGFALGARDYLVKPVRRDALSTALRRAGLLPEAGARRVWVVDADSTSRLYLVDELESAGWSVLSSPTVLDGLGKARAWQPEVVLLDLMSSADEGFDAVRVLREDLHLTSVPIVAVTPTGGDAPAWRHLADQITIAAEAGDAGVTELLRLLDTATATAPGRGGRT